MHFLSDPGPEMPHQCYESSLDIGTAQATPIKVPVEVLAGAWTQATLFSI